MKAEDSLQIAVANYLRLAYPKVLWTHVANERQTSPQRGAKLKKMGVRAGMPDLLIFKVKTETSRYSGLFVGLAIELKIGKNKPTTNQIVCLEQFESEGWYVDMCYSFDAAKKVIDNYLST